MNRKMDVDILGPAEAKTRWTGRIPLSGAEAVGLLFDQAQVVVASRPGQELVLDVEIRGESEAFAEWAPVVEERGGRLFLSEPVLACSARSVRVSLPPSVRALSVKTLVGDIEIRATSAALDLSTKSGDVSVDGGCDVLVKDASGDVKISDSNAVAVTVVSGEVSLEHCSGPVAVESDSGEISVQECDGRIAVRTATGNISTEGCPGPLALGSASGDVYLDDGSGSAGGMVETVSGDICAHLGGADLELQAQSDSGEIVVGDREASESFPKRLSVRIGRGGPELALSSASGDIDADY